MIEKIKFFTNKNDRVFFISPHLDDAILSAGALINELKNIKKITIVTVFTKASNKTSSSIKEFNRSCHCLDSAKLFKNREKEDIKLCKHLKINYLHLGFPDALWRDDFNSMDDIFSNKINKTKKEKNLERTIIKKLKKIINDDENTIIFAPLSIGNHVDHRIINKICKDNFTNVIYWEDYPYNLNLSIFEKFIKKSVFPTFKFNKNLFVKKKLIKFYKSQISMLFGNKPITLKEERYYLKKN
jgi:LmbE family N-acetylglucosaminyl deacetylase